MEMQVQKANSISGIRKLNLQFKIERREMDVCEKNDRGEDTNIITEDFFNMCLSFLQILETKVIENLKTVVPAEMAEDEIGYVN